MVYLSQHILCSYHPMVSLPVLGFPRSEQCVLLAAFHRAPPPPSRFGSPNGSTATFPLDQLMHQNLFICLLGDSACKIGLVVGCQQTCEEISDHKDMLPVGGDPFMCHTGCVCVCADGDFCHVSGIDNLSDIVGGVESIVFVEKWIVCYGCYSLML